jgi:hypothetical protein
VARRGRGRTGAGRGAVGAAVVLAVLALLACAETRRPLGEDCLKNGDCLSGVCAGLRCASAPPLLDGAGPDFEGGTDAAVADAADAATVDDAAGDGASGE